MAKIKLPYWLDAVWGKVQKNNVVFRRKGKTIVLESDPTPSYTRTDAQDFIRKTYYNALKSWYSLSPDEKKEYNEKGSKLGLSGWNVYVMETMKGTVYIPKIYEITINNSQNNNTLSDYQVLLNISNDSIFFSTVGDKKFMEFYDSDEITLLNHYVELWDAQNYNAKIWIKIPQIPASSTKKIYLKRNFTRTTDLSNPYNVFEFFDDFNVDLSKWTQLSGTWTLSADDSLSVLKSPTQDCSTMRSNTFKIKDAKVISKFRLYGGTNDIIYDLCARLADINNFYFFTYSGGESKLKIGKRVGGTWYSITSVNITPDLNYHILEGRLYGSQLKLFLDDVQKLSLTDTSFSTENYIGFHRGWNSNYIYIDYVEVAKYTEPEPSLTYTKL
jgi:hypothetical protein